MKGKKTNPGVTTILFMAVIVGLVFLVLLSSARAGIWEPVGRPRFTGPDNRTDHHSIYVEQDSGAPFLAYGSEWRDGRAVVAEYNEDEEEWGELAPVRNDIYSANNSLQVFRGIPYLAYQEPGGICGEEFHWHVSVKRYDEDNPMSWTRLGPDGLVDTWSFNPSLFLDTRYANPRPYIAFVETDDYDQDCGQWSLECRGNPTVMIYDGEEDEWNSLGRRRFSSDRIDKISLFVDEGIPHVAYSRDLIEAWEIVVQKFDGITWSSVSRFRSAFEGKVQPRSLAVEKGIPYVAFGDLDHGGRATVITTREGVWETVGRAGFSAGRAQAVNLYIYDGVIYVGYYDESRGNRATVMKYDEEENSWVPAGQPCYFSDGPVTDLSLHGDRGTLYVSYSDRSTFDWAATVMKCDVIPPVPEIDLALMNDDGLIGLPIASGETIELEPVQSGDSNSVEFTIYNTGRTDLIVGDIRFAAADNNNFRIGSEPDPVIPPGGRSSFSILFQPRSAGIHSTTVILDNNDTDEDPYLINLRGRAAQGPDMDLYLMSKVGNTIYNRLLPVSDGAGVNFGAVKGGESSTRNFIIINHGVGDLDIHNIVKFGRDRLDFIITQSPDPLINASERSALQIQFRPTMWGDRDAVLSIGNNDPDENPYTVRLYGVGTGKYSLQPTPRKVPRDDPRIKPEKTPPPRQIRPERTKPNPRRKGEDVISKKKPISSKNETGKPMAPAMKKEEKGER